MIAVARNKDAQLFRGLDDSSSIGNADRAIIDAQCGHDAASMLRASGAVRMYASNSSRNLVM